MFGRQGPELRAAIATSGMSLDAPNICRQHGCDAVCPLRKVYCRSCLDLELGSARANAWGIRTEAERHAALS